LNEFYYGNLAYGVEAAAETYFGTTADKLNLAQASFLAGLPQAPAIYDVYTNPDATRRRHQDVLVLMYEMSAEQDCIFVSNSMLEVCISAEDAVQAYNEFESYEFNSPGVQMRYPHWVNFIRSQLEAQFDPQTIYISGFSVYTTLDPELQNTAEEIISLQIEALKENNAHNGALVAIRPSTGEILAMVGSADFYDEEIDGQVNMALSPTRQPGSSIKPVTYLAAFEKGWTPGTLIWDVPSEFPPSGDPNDPRPPYKPVNYDGRIHGPVTIRSALANSYNIPAVKALQFVGIYDDPATPGEDGMISMAKRLGFTTLTRPDYGLSLTLGGGEVSLYEMTSMYAVIANGGRRIPPVGITKIVDRNGNVIFNYEVPAGDQVIRAEHAYLISSILSDNTARTPAFGPDSVLNLPFVTAAKTGTTNDFRDNWTLGYTPDIAVGTWVGNADYTPMQNTSGLTGAAPIWSEFMKVAVQKLTAGNPTPFFKPAGVIERVICSTSGTEPSQWCTNQRSEYFSSDQPPLSKEFDLWSKVNIDTWTGLRASLACSEFTSEELVLNVTDEWAKQWLRDADQGRSWATEMGLSEPILFLPSRECKSDDPRPYLSFTSFGEDQTVTTTPLEIFARIDASADFNNYSLRYGEGLEPIEWHLLKGDNQPVNPANVVYSWDISNMPAGQVTLHLLMNSTRDTYAEKYIRLNLQVPTPTPTPTSTPVPTLTPTPTPTPTSTSVPTQTPTPTPTITLTSVPTATTIPTNTPEPTNTTEIVPTTTPTVTP
jgi:membrane peptidoglycan carboxypeptidase